MAADHDHDDSVEGQFDLELTRRLLVFIRPYWRPVAWSVLFMCIGVVMGLAFPMITKMAIDDYLARLHQVYQAQTVEQAKDVAARFPAKRQPQFLDSKTLVIASSAISSLDPREAATLQRDPALKPDKYYVFPETACPPELKQPRLQGGCWLVREDELKQVPPRQWLQIRQTDWSGIVWLAMAGLLICILNLLADYYHVLLLSQAGQAAMADLRTKVFAHLESLSLDYFNKHPMGRLVTRVTNDVGALNDLLTTVLVQFFRDVLMLVGSVAVLFWLDAKLALFTMVTIPLFTIATLFFKVKLRDIYRQSRRYLSSLNSHLAEDISGFKIIQIFRQAGRRRREYEEVNDNYFRSTFREVKWFGIFRPTVEIICAAGIAIVFIYGGSQALQGAMKLGAFVAFITYVDRMFRPLSAMCDKYTIMQSAMAAAERLVAILDEKPKIIEAPDAVALAAPMAGRVDLENIHFSYIPGQPILRGVSFSVQPGKSVAIVGPTGAGKSSIISLLCRFYDTDAGTVKIDERDIRGIPFAELRRGIAIVLQDSFIFSRSIRENITMGAGYNEERVRQAATLVQANEFIENLANGYDSEMEERGSTLSSGQKQLLCFARALAHDPKILVLDEATSNIDPATEQLIQQAIDTLMKNRTCVIVAHRLSTIRKADEILVLDGGQIIERGSHDELLAKRGAYYNLYLLQYQNQ
jgi:ATP-binding cassette subfamily B protein/subfamily B ATP-binding cassette protein MsbA